MPIIVVHQKAMRGSSVGHSADIGKAEAYLKCRCQLAPPGIGHRPATGTRLRASEGIHRAVARPPPPARGHAALSARRHYPHFRDQRAAEGRPLSRYVQKHLARAKRLITRDIENAYLAFDPSEEAPIHALIGHSIGSRPGPGRRVFTLQTLPPDLLLE